MNAQSTQDNLAQFPIQELTQIETAIQASLQLLAILNDRRGALTAELDRITRPPPAVSKPPLKTIGPGLEYRGTLARHWNYIDIHIDLLRRLWIEFPDRRESMANDMGRYGKTRAYVAQTLDELFPGQPKAWARRYSRKLVDGWYVDTNLNRERMRRVLPAAVAAAGLTWGKDVKAYWRPTQVAT